MKILHRILFSLIFIPVIGADASIPARLPAWLLEVPDSVHDILVADTSGATLLRYRNNGNGIEAADERYMSIGQNGVGKQRAWDRKTPLGIYFITEELDTSRLHDKYGVAAYVLDYPNAWDRYRHRGGSGIWLHGVDRHHPARPPLDTDGCLALPNEEIARLAGELVPLETPLIVARTLEWTTPEALGRRRAEFRDRLALWQESIEQTDLATYLSLYADDFRHYDMDKSAWAAFRQRVFAARGQSELELRDLLLLADPEEPGLYLSRFTQVLQAGEREIVLKKRLYWRRSEAGDWRIVTEDAG